MVNEKVAAWKWLSESLKRIQDPILRNSMLAELKQRALKEWGYFPGTGMLAKKEPVILDDWEQELVSDIKKAQDFEIDTRAEKRNQTAKEAHARMMQLIVSGGTLADIPDDIRSDTIDKLYYQCLMEYGDQIMQEADRFIGDAK